MPDIGTTETFSLEDTLQYSEERDYFRSAVNVLSRKGMRFSHGVTCTIRGDIPINAGTASSSALVVAWIDFLAKLSDQGSTITPEQVAELAYEGEVLEFSGPGGMMDHYSVSLGGVLFIDFHPAVSAERISHRLGTFVLGNSGEPKDTVAILARVKHGVIDILDHLREQEPDFSLRELTDERMRQVRTHLTEDQYNLLSGTLRNYQITLEAKEVLKQRKLDPLRVGQLLNEHQMVLRDTLRISTPKIDRMIDAALAAGAVGAKINGSGGGGCMFAYAPDNPQEVAAAVERGGGKSVVVEGDDGVRSEWIEKVESTS